MKDDRGLNPGRGAKNEVMGMELKAVGAGEVETVEMSSLWESTE